MNPNNIPVATVQPQSYELKQGRSKIKTWVIVSNVAFLLCVAGATYLNLMIEDFGVVFGFMLLVGILGSAWLPILLVAVIIALNIASGVGSIVLNTIYFPGRMNVTRMSKVLIRILWVILNTVLYVYLWFGPSIILAG